MAATWLAGALFCAGVTLRGIRWAAAAVGAPVDGDGSLLARVLGLEARAAVTLSPTAVCGLFFAFLVLSALLARARRDVTYYHERQVATADELRERGLGAVPDTAGGKQLYLDLMKRSLINIMYCESSRPVYFYGPDKKYLLSDGFNLERRVMGEDMPENAMTMVGLLRLNNIQESMEDVIGRGVPGDFVETGSCKGGAVIFMRAVLKAMGVTDRTVYACDTFAVDQPPANVLVHAVVGALLWVFASVPFRAFRKFLLKIFMAANPHFPADDNPADDEVDALTFLLKNAIWIRQRPGVLKGLRSVRSNFARYGLLDGQVKFLQGWFKDTIPHSPIERIAVLRLDGDTYPSTMDGLRLCYPKLSPGGICIVDDYNSLEGCKRAVDDYRKEHGIAHEIHRIDGLAVYWRNGGE